MNEEDCTIVCEVEFAYIRIQHNTYLQYTYIRRNAGTLNEPPTFRNLL